MRTEVEARELSLLAMVGGKEGKYRIVVDKGVVKQWVGIGWIELRKATETDLDTYPVVVRSGT